MASRQLSFDEILTEYIGGHGVSQLKFTLAFTLPYGFSLGLVFIVIFASYVPDHRCQILNCDTQDRKVRYLNCKVIY